MLYGKKRMWEAVSQPRDVTRGYIQHKRLPIHFYALLQKEKKKNGAQNSENKTGIYIFKVCRLYIEEMYKIYMGGPLPLYRERHATRFPGNPSRSTRNTSQ